MTGRDLIIYIVQNHLEDAPIDENGRFLNLISTKEAAVKFNVGEATIRIWYQMKGIDGVMIGDTLYILPDAQPRVNL